MAKISAKQFADQMRDIAMQMSAAYEVYGGSRTHKKWFDNKAKELAKKANDLAKAYFKGLKT